MKYVIVLGDGMADEPIEAAGGKTPLQLADKPVMDEMAKVSEQGIAYTVPSNLPAGSDVANLSMLGYDPQVYYSGRSPLEALSIGVDMKDTDIALRCNVVTVSEDEDYEDKTIIDHSAGAVSYTHLDVYKRQGKDSELTITLPRYSGVLLKLTKKE